MSPTIRSPALPGAGRVVRFFVVLIAAFTALNFLIDMGLRRIESDAFGVLNNIVTGQINAAILISGSSRALTDYDPRIITSYTGESAWNIGMNGSQTDMQLAILKTYLAHNSVPNSLIHNLDSFAFKTSKEGIVDPETVRALLEREAHLRCARFRSTVTGER